MGMGTERELADSAARRVEELGAVHQTHHVVHRKPGAATGVLMGLACGSSETSLAKQYGLNRDVVARFKKENQEWISDWRAIQLREVATQAAKAQRLANMKMDELLEDGEARAKVSVKDLAVTQAVFLDKVERLAGAPDVRVEVTHEFGLEDAREWLERARAAKGRVVDVGDDEAGEG